MTPTLVTVAPGQQLEPGAAASYLRARQDGCPAGITSSWRSSAEQARLHAEWLADPAHHAFALPAGQSKHELGLALDLVRPAADWMHAHPQYGWRFTNPNEWWHVEHFAALDTTAGAGNVLAPPAPADPAPTQEEDDTMKPWFFAAKSGEISIVGPQGPKALSPDEWQTWYNLGYRVEPTMSALDPGPYAAVWSSLTTTTAAQVAAAVVAQLTAAGQGAPTAAQVVDEIARRLS